MFKFHHYSFFATRQFTITLHSEIAQNIGVTNERVKLIVLNQLASYSVALHSLIPFAQLLALTACIDCHPSRQISSRCANLAARDPSDETSILAYTPQEVPPTIPGTTTCLSPTLVHVAPWR